jgi:hypothetical protein
MDNCRRISRRVVLASAAFSLGAHRRYGGFADGGTAEA